MNRMRKLLMLGGLATALCVGAGSALAQNDGGPGGGGPGGGGPGGGGFGGGPGGGGRGNFDPAQMQQMMMDNLREQLEVKDDAEWTVLQAQIQKVMDARRQVGGGGGGMGMMGMRGPRGGNGGPDGNGGPGGGGPGGRRGGQTSAEADALRKAIDANASSDDLKAAVAKFVDARKQKQAALEKAQSDLQKLLSVRQEAIAYSAGLL